MEHRTLIVARMDAGDADAVADVFARSDATELPHLVGVSRRTLFRYYDLYFHLVEADRDVAGQVDQARTHPLFREVDQQLRPFIQPYSPDWRSPRDAMARSFYTWSAR
ncbi:TcmI family type II polyketide cyclase [Actinokineospora enzanensis]|uniref:TcmI family type II polyketide cyclase n=1 Tax=Actinokineospora enzanensis TaxID=155975 RepID=UPI000371934A|nr:TcmI family type II polyketide cyclase [Actinokineospora enzanensis]